MSKLVLMVDDDRLPMSYYVKALEKEGFNVEHCLEPDSALDFANKKGSEIDLIILDVMMPPGKVFEKEDTHEGLRTGVFLLKEIRKICSNMPIVILTNVKNSKTLDEFVDKPMIRIIQKIDCPPFDLIEIVNEILKTKDENINKRNSYSQKITKKGENVNGN